MIKKYEIKINPNLYKFINDDVLKGLKINKDSFWKNLSKIIKKLSSKNNKLLSKRTEMQNLLNKWHKENKGKEINFKNYKKYLIEIGYIVKEGKNFKVNTKNVDPEIANISGPQLVVPITNARYALNAVNARWGSLYDALYGTDVLDKPLKNNNYDTKRGAKVIEYAKSHLDKFAPLKKSNWNKITNIDIKKHKLFFKLDNNTLTSLKFKNQIVGVCLDSQKKIKELILKKNNLHCRILINTNHPIGKNDTAKIADIILESAISTILDCEDSVATVDAEDKILAYKNWLGLMKGDLESEFEKNGKSIKRSLNKDVAFLTLDGEKKFLKGRSLMIIRNVGHLMTTSAILDQHNLEIGEGILDGVITTLISLYDLKQNKKYKNSLYNSIYIVKPKMHGPEEVEFTNDLFNNIEKMLSLKKNTIKIGIMDEERRTSINLKECIRAAKSRVAFINTGFLDRTGDEIHTSMYAGPFVTKKSMKNSEWLEAYENRNVEIGLECGLQGRAQIGKGMWAMPDLMKKMIEIKISHPKAGANCSWVPSPTAATLHALHYHLVNVTNIQNKITKSKTKNNIEGLLTLPLLKGKNLSENEIITEIENNTQSILGYVVRWIDQGIGCSKVPDINNIGLMEDRATCRIASQAISNWIKHGVITKEKVIKTLKKMAKVVDKQNAHDPKYINMGPKFDSIAFKAAKELILKGINQPSGYTEPILHKRRLEFKSNYNKSIFFN